MTPASSKSYLLHSEREVSKFGSLEKCCRQSVPSRQYLEVIGCCIFKQVFTILSLADLAPDNCYIYSIYIFNIDVFQCRPHARTILLWTSAHRSLSQFTVVKLEEGQFKVF